MDVEGTDVADGRTRRKSLEEAGGSSFAPWQVLFGFRLLGVATILAVAVLDLRAPLYVDGLHNALFRTLTIAAYVGTASTFLCLAMSSLLFGLRRGRSIPLLLPAHTFVITFTAYLLPYISWMWAHVATVDFICLAPLAIFAVDVLILRAKMGLRYFDGIPSLLVLNVVYVACLLIVPSIRVGFSWLAFGIQCGIVAATIALLFFVISLTHINFCPCDGRG